MATKKKCALDECQNWVKERRRAYCSAACSQVASSSSGSAQPMVKDEVKFKGDVCEITKTTPTRVKSLEDLIRVCEIDTSIWEIKEYECGAYEQASVPRAVGSKAEGWKRPSTEPVISGLFTVKAKLVRKRAIVDARAEIASLIEDAKKKIPARSAAIISRRSSSGIMLEPHIPDLHVGKLAWGKETGDEDYDSGIARRVFEQAVDALLERSAGFKIDQIVFPVGNDLLHSDTKQGTTTGGTILDTDSRYHKNFTIARQIITKAIERFRSVAPDVIVKLIPGNHDTLSVWHLGDSLECFYHATQGVAIDNGPTMRKYQQHGRVMVMWTHGNRGKLADYPLLMATEQPEMFAATCFREAHTGDKHQLRVQEHRGVKVRISPALCPSDAWHSEMLFTGNDRAAEAFIWSAADGLVGTANFTVPSSRLDSMQEAA